MSSIFGAVATLPHGRHSLSREQVAESQRARLLAAVTELVAERGYASLTITEAARRARVAPNRFYEHFRDKEDCFLAAYDAFAQALLARMAAVTLATGDWHDFVASTLDAYLRTLDAEPACARAFLVEMSGAGAEARRRRRDMHSTFATLLGERHRRMRATDPRLGALPESVYQGLVHAVRELACDQIERHPERPLTELAPDIVLWISATLLGAGMKPR